MSTVSSMMIELRILSYHISRHSSNPSPTVGFKTLNNTDRTNVLPYNCKAVPTRCSTAYLSMRPRNCRAASQRFIRPRPSDGRVEGLSWRLPRQAILAEAAAESGVFRLPGCINLPSTILVFHCFMARLTRNAFTRIRSRRRRGFEHECLRNSAETICMTSGVFRGAKRGFWTRLLAE